MTWRMTLEYLVPDIRPPYGNYHHGVVVPSNARWLFTSGQLGVSKEDAIPSSVLAQTEQCFLNIEEILFAAGMEFCDVVRINAYVTDRKFFSDYMSVRDRFIAQSAPASTLMVVAGFTREEMKVEVEITAARAIS